MVVRLPRHFSRRIVGGGKFVAFLGITLPKPSGPKSCQVGASAKAAGLSTNSQWLTTRLTCHSRADRLRRPLNSNVKPHACSSLHDLPILRWSRSARHAKRAAEHLAGEGGAGSHCRFPILACCRSPVGAGLLEPGSGHSGLHTRIGSHFHLASASLCLSL